MSEALDDVESIGGAQAGGEVPAAGGGVCRLEDGVRGGRHAEQAAAGKAVVRSVAVHHDIAGGDIVEGAVSVRVRSQGTGFGLPQVDLVRWLTSAWMPAQMGLETEVPPTPFQLPGSAPQTLPSFFVSE